MTLTRKEQLDLWKQEIIDLKTGHEWAFYTGKVPRSLEDSVRRITELHALIDEHTE